MEKSKRRVVAKERNGKNTKSSSPRSEHAELVKRRHEQIAVSAANVMRKKGFHQTTIRDIARACGMSMGQLYSYINSKDDVLYLVFKHMYDETFISRLEREEEDLTQDPVTRLRGKLYRSLKYIMEQKKSIQLVFTESRYLDKSHLQKILDLDRDYILGYWRKALSTLDVFEDHEKELNFAAAVIHYLHVFLPMRAWTLDDRSLDDSINSLIDFILRGIGISEK
jgi:AcrR family transcriptional regulator